jgi:hypothetical protein
LKAKKKKKKAPKLWRQQDRGDRKQSVLMLITSSFCVAGNQNKDFKSQNSSFLLIFPNLGKLPG